METPKQEMLNVPAQHRIAFALWLDEAHSANVGPFNQQPSLSDLTLSWLRFGFQGEVFKSSCLKTLLTSAMQAGCTACFIQRPGHIISEDWMLPHWQIADFYTCLAQQAKKDDFLVCAVLTQVQDYFSIDTNGFLVHLERYQQLGLPEFGFATEKTQLLLRPKVQQSTLPGTTDHYWWLEASEETVYVQTVDAGWHFIERSLREQLKVPCLPVTVTDKTVCLTQADQHWPQEEKPISKEHSAKQNFLTGVGTQLSRGRSGVFLWNIESYGDIANALTKPRMVTRNLYCVAAGFKPNMLLHKHGFDADTTVTFFDYSRAALQVRQTLIEEWDGTDYPSFCRYVLQRFPASETFYQLWNGIQTTQIDWQDVEQLWQAELLHWGGADAFRQVWQQQKKLTYQFVHCDVINNPNPLIDYFQAQGEAIIWWSNAFFTISSNWLLSIDQRHERYLSWINLLAETMPQCLLYGADHVNAPVNNITAQNYAALLAQHSGDFSDGGLVPKWYAAQPLRF